MTGMHPGAPEARSARRSWREPHPCRMSHALAGAALTALWVFTTVWLGDDAVSRIWVIVVAGVIASAAALALARYGDRAAAAGVAATTGAVLAFPGLTLQLSLLSELLA